MKTYPLLLLSLLALSFISCGISKPKKIIFISPDGIEKEFRLYDFENDGKLSSGGSGNNSYREVRSLSFSVEDNFYKLKTDEKTYYFPLDYIVEIPKE